MGNFLPGDKPSSLFGLFVSDEEKNSLITLAADKREESYFEAK
jgi:hypothetical protein